MNGPIAANGDHQIIVTISQAASDFNSMTGTLRHVRVVLYSRCLKCLLDLMEILPELSVSGIWIHYACDSHHVDDVGVKTSRARCEI